MGCVVRSQSSGHPGPGQSGQDWTWAARGPRRVECTRIETLVMSTSPLEEDCGWGWGGRGFLPKGWFLELGLGA